MAQRGTEEWRRNVSHGNKGKTPWNKGLDKSDPRVARNGTSTSKGRRGIAPWNKGKKLHYPVWNKGTTGYKQPNISLALIGRPNLKITGENHYGWKGDDVGYKALHAWLRRKYGKPDICEFCGSNKFLNWANKTGKYLRDRGDWLWLCKSCHNKYDNIADNLPKPHNNID